MIISARQVDVFAHAEPVDMRKSFDTLAALVKDGRFTEIVGADVSSRALDQAARRLRLDRLPDRQRDRVRPRGGRSVAKHTEERHHAIWAH